ncbi:MAG: transposase, partial [Zoogloea sp.]|uniref:transposase n=1 Tax=Zoogloea sp. TaxID=49181 RepID=UPI0026342E7A
MSSRFALIKREALDAQREQAQAPAVQARIEQAQAVLAKRPEATQRTIQRTAGQALKEALRQVMAQPGARRAFAQRKAMVEPVFSALRERQGLNRFRRRGLRGVRLEFRLHLMCLQPWAGAGVCPPGALGPSIALCLLHSTAAPACERRV